MRRHSRVLKDFRATYLPNDAIRALTETGHRKDKALHWLRNRCDGAFLQDVFKRLPLAQESLRSTLFGQPFPRDWGSCIFPRKNPKIANIGRSVLWHVAVFRHHAQFLSKHCTIRDTYFQHALFGKWTEANQQLVEHQSTLGHSIWLLAQTFFTKEELAGTAANRTARDTFSQTYTSELIGVIAVCLSLRAEKAISRAQFSSLLRQLLGTELSQEIRDFFALLLSPAPPTLECDLTDLLALLDVLPIVDRYEMFVRLCLFTNAQSHPDAKRFTDALSTLSADISDPVTAFAVSALTSGTLTDLTDTSGMLSAWDDYVSGDYTSCAISARTLAEQIPLAFQAHELLTKASLYSSHATSDSRSTLAETLWHHLRIIYEKAVLTEDSLGFLSSLALRLNETSLSLGLLATYELHATSKPDQKILRAAALSHRVHGPRNMEHGFSSSNSLEYLVKLRSAYPDSISSAFFQAVAENDLATLRAFLSIPMPRRLFFIGLSAARTGDFEEARRHLEHFLKISESNQYPCSPFAIEEARIVLANVLLTGSDLQRLQEVVVDSYFERTHSIKRFPLTAIYRACYAKRRELAASIYYPILAYLANDDPHAVSMAVTLFLSAHGLEKPLELNKLTSESFPRQAFLFFLQRVCTPEVLDSLEFYTTAEVEAERIGLLRWLVQLDETLRPACQAEVLRITETAELREALNRVEGSRVEVNLAGIREAEESHFKELYFRFTAFRDIIPYVADIALQPLWYTGRTTLYSVRKEDVGRIISAQEGHNRLVRIFIEAFRDIREVFLNSPQFGLDACLSVRIRHGILTQHLRRPFYQEHLLFDPSDGNSGGVLEYWLGYLTLPTWARDTLRASLQDVTDSVLGVADEVKNKWIQVGTEDQSSEGHLFDYSFDDRTLSDLFREQNVHRAEYNTFIDIVFSILSDRTRHNLSIVRNQVAGPLLRKLNAILLGAEERTACLATYGGYEHFRDALSRCRNEVQKTVNAMGSWFIGSDAALMEDVTILLAANTAAGMVDRLHPGMRSRISVSVLTKYKLRGRFFSPFVYLLYFLVDNALRHSGIPEERLNIKLVIENDQSRISITVKHLLSDDKDAKERAAWLNNRVTELLGSFDFKKVRSEGGSGLVKILATLSLEFDSRSYRVLAESGEDNVLAVRIEFNGGGIIA